MSAGLTTILVFQSKHWIWVGTKKKVVFNIFFILKPTFEYSVPVKVSLFKKARLNINQCAVARNVFIHTDKCLIHAPTGGIEKGESWHQTVYNYCMDFIWNSRELLFLNNHTIWIITNFYGRSIYSIIIKINIFNIKNNIFNE